MSVAANCARWRHSEFRSVTTGLSADIQRFLNKSPENRASGDTFKSRLSALLTPQLLCLVGYRISHYLHVNGWKRLAAMAARLNMLVHKLNLPADSCVGPGCFLPHPASVCFYGSAGSGLTLYSQAVCVPGEGVVRLGDDVGVAAHASLVGGLEIGSRTKVSFAVPLRRSVAEGSLVIAPAVWGSQLSRKLVEREVGV